MAPQVEFNSVAEEVTDALILAALPAMDGAVGHKAMQIAKPLPNGRLLENPTYRLHLGGCSGLRCLNGEI